MAGVRLAGSWVLVAAVAAAAAAAAATTTAAAGTVHRAAASVCDIINDAPENTTCVAAHSLVRALYSSYDGPLYQVLRTSDNRTLDVSVVEPGGFADSAAQDEHCADAGCVVWRIYDQSPFQNHLDVAPPGGNWPHKDIPVNATRESLYVGGHRVYGAWFELNMGYRRDGANGTALGNDPETIYAVVNGRHYNADCCFDYGNAEFNDLDTGKGAMEAIYFGNLTTSGQGSGHGPWVMADLEKGLWPGNESFNEANIPMDFDFVTAVLKGRTDGFVLKGGNAQAGSLIKLFDGPRPAHYQPMNKTGSIILGIGGDNSPRGVGTFYEGIMATGVASDDTDAAVQANIVEARYGHSTQFTRSAEKHASISF